MNLRHLEKPVVEVVKLNHEDDDKSCWYKQIDEQVLSAILLQSQIFQPACTIH